MNDFVFRKAAIPLIILLFAFIAAFSIVRNEKWLIGIFLLGLVIIVFLRPFWGLILFAALIPLESSFLSLGGGAASVTRFLGLLVFGVWVLRILSTRVKIFLTSDVKILLAFTLWGCISYFWAFNSESTISRIQTAVQLMMLTFLVINLANDHTKLAALITALFIGCVVTTFLGVGGINVNSGTYQLTLQNQGANEYGCYVGVIFLIGTLLLAFNIRKFRFIGIAAILISIIPLFQVNERGTFLAIGTTWLVIALVTRQKVKAIILIILMALAFAILPPFLEQRGAISSFNAERLTIANILETGGSGRTDIWGAGIRMFADNFLLGTGWGNFPVVYDKYANPMEIITSNLTANGKDPHGDLMGVAGELGIIGLILFLIVFLRVFLRNLALVQTSWNSQNRLLTILVFALLLYMFSLGFTSTFLWRKVYWLILGLGMSLPVLINQRVNIKPVRFHRF